MSTAAVQAAQKVTGPDVEIGGATDVLNRKNGSCERLSFLKT